MKYRRFRSTLLVTCVLLAGCAQSFQDMDRASAPASDTQLSDAATVPMESVKREPGNSIAGLPDNGVLLEYAAAPVRGGDGAYILHPVQLSEAHAFAAVHGDELVVPAPNGDRIRLRYERHEEQQDGNWTWVGRAADGDLSQEAVITFGPDAVFGSIPQASGMPLQIATRDGRTYLMEGDPDRLKPVAPEGNDGVLPPPIDADAEDGMMVEQMVGQVMDAVSAESDTSAGSTYDAAPAAVVPPMAAAAAATAMPQNTIDLLIGYTTGFRTAQGSESVARTRLSYLVAVANQALVNSKVSATMRMVASIEVDYSDGTSNNTALDDLTGRGQGSNGPVAGLAALHSARDRYGADLVSLVRHYDRSVHGGCGVAWLLGGGGSEITQGSAGYGFSVVSDGSVQAGSTIYFCSDETLAHEVGHNLGLAHDVENAGGTGRYSYSYGYKANASQGNFYTVMAYGDSGQTGIRIFSNPDVKSCKGYACGVANQADNSRTLRQTVPAVSAFRNTMMSFSTGKSGDYNKDGRDDVLWRNFGSGANIIWLAADTNNRRATNGISSQEWRVVGVGDFDRDGASDILWRNFATGANIIWPAGNYASRKSLSSIADSNWKVVGVGDFDGDGRDDILWRNFATGSNIVWPSGSYAARKSLTRISNLNWMVVGVGDFNGDGRDDILWRNASTGANTIWLSGNYAMQQPQKRISSLDWKIVGVGDFNGDGRDDVLWRNTASGANTIWLSGNYDTQMAMSKIANQNWRVVSVGDYNGDGLADIFWRNTASGSNNVWYSGNYGLSQTVGKVASQAWEVMP